MQIKIQTLTQTFQQTQQNCTSIDNKTKALQGQLEESRLAYKVISDQIKAR